MTEKILSIEDVDDITVDGNTHMEGFKITTNKQEIFVLISNESNCCESWGHFASHDEEDYFIGATLTGISLVDDALDQIVLKNKMCFDEDDTMIQFVNLETDKGVLQLTVYNNHNGYYSHQILIKSEQVTKEDYL